jgi:hypothetical protein
MDEIEKGKRYWVRMDQEAQVMAIKNPSVAIWRDDSETLALFVQMINSNGRLSLQIVNAWLKQHHKVLVDEPTTPA